MKKHQLAAMVLSALSAGILISCSKPADEAQPTANKQAADVKPATESSETAADTTAVKAIALSDASAESYLKQVADTQIISAYKNVVEQSQALNALATQSCQADGSVAADKLAALRAQWLQLAKAWAQAEIIGFGPAMDSMSNLYINYYPDERGLVHQGVIDLIAANPNLTPEQLASESAIVQGIPGLEEVLYANDSLDKSQCQYVISASAALANRLDKVSQDWQASPQSLLSYGSPDDNKEGLNRWVNSILALVETTKSTSLDQPLGITGNKKGHLPADAAGQSREIITAKVAALNKALTDPALVAILSENGQDTLADKLSTLLSDTLTLLAQLPEDLATATPEQQKALYDKLTELAQVVKRQLMPTLGVQVGFNSTDGD